MNTFSLRIAATVVLLWGIPALAQNPNNPIEDALLRWYQANTAAQFTTVLSMATPACTSPEGLAYDGAHMWVACFGSNSLVELDISDGSRVQSVSLPPSTSGPSALLYDGQRIWATNKAAGTITPVNASTGAVGTALTVGTNPAGMTFDGENIWVAISTGTTQIAKVNVATGMVKPISILTNADPTGGCNGVVGIVYYAPDPGVPIVNNLSQSLWVVCNSSPHQVVELNPQSSGSSFPILAYTPINQIGSCPCNNIAFDGRYVWIATPSVPTTVQAAVQQIDTTTTSITGLTVTNTNLPMAVSPVAVAFDGVYIWAIDGSNSHVFKVLPSTTAGQPGTVGTFNNPGGASTFLGFDGGNMWISSASAIGGLYSLQKM